MRSRPSLKIFALVVALAVIAAVVIVFVVGRGEPVPFAPERATAPSPETDATERGATIADPPDRTAAPDPEVPAATPTPGLVLRGTIHEADGRPCGEVPIHRAARPDGYPESMAAPDEAWSHALGETSEDGSFEVRLETALTADEWLEFRLCDVAFARYRPTHLRGEHVLIVPRLVETEVAIVGLGFDEAWTLESHPAERTEDDDADLKAVLDVVVTSPDGDLVLRCHYHGWPEQDAPEFRTVLPAPVAWSFGVRASIHSIEEPFRIADAGARVVFRAGLPEQRIVVEIVDGEGLTVQIGGRIEVHGEKGYSLGEFEDGRVELRPPFGGQIEGDLRAVAVLDDGETFEASWPQELWGTAPRVTLRRGRGRAAVTVVVDGAVSDLRGVNADGTLHWVHRVDPPWVHGTSWWEPTEHGDGVRVCVPPTVRRLWCVARRAGEGEPADRIVVLERTGPDAFAVTWPTGRVSELANELPPVPLRSVRVQAAIPDLPPTEDHRWLTIRTVLGGELPDPLLVFRPAGMETRVRILKVEGRPRVEHAPASWR